MILYVFDMNKLGQLWKKYKEYVLYLVFGGLTTVVSWGSYSIFTLLFRNITAQLGIFGLKISVQILLANVLSWILAVLFAFVTNKLWVFESKSWRGKVVLPELAKFVGARLLTGVIEIVLVPLLVSIGLNQTIFGIEGALSKILVSIIVIILNYFFSKFLIFKKDRQ